MIDNRISKLISTEEQLRSLDSLMVAASGCLYELADVWLDRCDGLFDEYVDELQYIAAQLQDISTRMEDTYNKAKISNFNESNNVNALITTAAHTGFDLCELDIIFRIQEAERNAQIRNDQKMKLEAENRNLNEN